MALGYTIWRQRAVMKRMGESTEYLRDVVGELAKLHIPPYAYSSICYKHEIFISGDEQVTRLYRVRALDHPLSWIKMKLGASSDASIPNLHLRAWAKRGRSNTPCYTALYENSPQRKRALIVFASPLAPGKEETIGVTYTWPHAWDDLILDGKDEAWYEIPPDVDMFEVQIVFPRELKIERAWVEPKLGEIIIKTDRVLSWTAKNPPKNLYRLRIETTR